MRNKFLCPTHRDWLQQNPEIAQRCWHDTLDVGDYCQSLDMWQASLKPLGSAFDMAYICMSQMRRVDQATADLYLKNAEMLIFAWLKVDDVSQAKTLFQAVSAELNRSQALLEVTPSASFRLTKLSLLIGATEQKKRAFQQCTNMQPRTRIHASSALH